MRNILVLALTGFLFVTLAVRSEAQESSPRFTIGGRGLASFNINRASLDGPGGGTATDDGAVSDFSDSFLLLRLDQLLYERHRAGMVIGFLFPDAETDLGEVFYNQVNVFYDAKTFAGTMGRTRLNNFLFEFPTLREEDVLDYGFVLNALSNAKNSEFSRYGNVVKAEAFALNSRLAVGGQVANWTVTDSTGARVDDFEINAFSGQVTYRLPGAIRYTEVLRQAGVAVHAQDVQVPGQRWIYSFLASGAVNLTRHPLRNIELAGQVVYNRGISDAASGTERAARLGTPMGRARARSTAFMASLRFLRRPYQLERLQASVTGGYKSYEDIDASQFVLVPNLFFRLGQGVDLGVQYQFETFRGELAAIRGRSREHSVKLTLAFNFQARFNDYFGDRDDILNMEHGYVR
ncbi:MAG: hypothetical protein BMS9Abin29_2486 [Gemmatimonadota bacterium]|nr:MAG: hypothetical protein BMS9Abin29_2486 [Gemmatimonadota bacterium]